MNDQQARQALRASIADAHMDRTERNQFRDWLVQSEPDGSKRAVYQSMAFELANEAIERGTASPHSVLNWLERVVKMLTPLASTHPASAPSEACFTPEHDCAGRIVRLFEQARRSVDVCVFTITDDRITRAIEAAHRRGVRLRIVTDDEKQLDPGSDIERITTVGVQVRMDNTGFHMHHKFALFDGSLLLTGSYNWTRSASLHNEENFIITSEPRLLNAFSGLFEKLWSQFDPRA